MKCKLDICRIQWLNREFLPFDYAFKYNKNESRFTRIFNSISNNNKINDNNIDIKIRNSELNNYILSNNNNISKSNDIDIKKILSMEERRKTLIIKNIPNKFTIDDFLRIFSEFNEKFNLFLIPTDIKRKKNYGYAYINFLESLDGKRWPNTNSIKICELLFSKIQGTTKIIKHFPIKNMYQKLINNENKSTKQIIIPLCYYNFFNEIYPEVEIKMNNIKNDIFLVEHNIFLNRNKNIINFHI